MNLSLSILLWLPLAAGLIGLLLPGGLARWLSLGGAVLALLFAVALLVDFDDAAGLQHVTDVVWIEELGIHYKLGVDGLNLFLILLTTFAFTAVTLWAALGRQEREAQFHFHLSLGHTAVLGAVLAQDLAIFVVFFDLMLVPFFFLTGGWSHLPRGERIAATLKLFVYTLVGSLLMLAAAVATGVLASPNSGASFVLSDLAGNGLAQSTQTWLFLAFAAAFLVKMPLFPLHGWMPDGYRAMPLPVLAVFSAVLSKVAAYGFLRIVLPLFPDAAAELRLVLGVIALASILYGSAMAFTTTEARLILGYSSMAQLGFIVLGIASIEPTGAQGALLQSVSHGLVTLAAFFVVGLLAVRAGGSQDIRDMGGIAFRAPVLATLFLIVALATLAMPGSVNFAGEFLILLGAFSDQIVIAVIAFTGVVLASVYMLRAFIRTMHGRVGPRVESRDLSVRDGLVLVPIVTVIVALSIYPQVALERSEVSAQRAIAPARAAKAPQPPAQAVTGVPPGAVVPGTTP